MLLREYIQMHEVLPMEEYLAYQCLAFLEQQALPAEKGNPGRWAAFNRVVRSGIESLEAESDLSTLVERMCENLDKEDRLLESREVSTGTGPAARLADGEEAPPKGAPADTAVLVQSPPRVCCRRR